MERLRHFGALIESHRKWAISLIMLLSLGFHLLALLLEKSSPDMETWMIVGNAVINGQDFYLATAPPRWHLYFPYPPLWALVLGSTALIVNPQLDPTSYLIIVRLLLMLGDFMVGLILLKAFNASLPYFAFWMLNPMIIGVAQSGQFDVLPTLASLLALIAHKKGRSVLTGILVGLGFSLKIWPIFLLPALIANHKDDRIAHSLKLVGASFVVAMAISLPFALTTTYLSNFANVVGLNATTPLGHGLFSPIALYMLMMLVLIGILSIKFKPPLSLLSALIIDLLLIILPPNIQYALWLMPYLILCLMEGFSPILFVLTNVVWIFHFLQRYSMTFYKSMGFATGLPLVTFEIIYIGVAAYIALEIVRDKTLGPHCCQLSSQFI
jgi:hypothetical protein